MHGDRNIGDNYPLGMMDEYVAVARRERPFRFAAAIKGFRDFDLPEIRLQKSNSFISAPTVAAVAQS